MHQIAAGAMSIRTGDSVVDLLLRYAALIARERAADTVEFRALDATGRLTTVTVLVTAALPLVAVAVEAVEEEPDNQPAEAYLRSRIEQVLRRRTPPFEELAGMNVWNGDPEK